MFKCRLTATQSKITIQLPDDLVGKTIEVLVYEVEQAKPAAHIDNKKKEFLNNALDKYRVDLSGFKFNRDEANDYE